MILTVETIVAVPPQLLPLNSLYVAVPPAWKKPARVDESVTEEPTVMDGADSVVLIVGLALLIVKGSQVELPPLLLTSPEYIALKLNEPAGVRTTEPELGITPLITGTVETTAGVPTQLAPANSSYLTVPPAWKEPASTAESETDEPTVIVVAERLVVILGFALLTTSGSHGDVAPELLVSPL